MENLPAYFDARVLTRDYQEPGSGQVSGRYAGYQLGTTADPDQDFAVSYGYDTAGRLNGVTSPAGSYAYGYALNSNLFASVTSPVHVAATVYEPQRDVIDYVENKVGTTTISKYDYTVNAIGQRSSRAQSGTSFPPSFGNNPVDNFAYNPKGEVISSNRPVFPVFDQNYTYDQIGNLRYHGRTSSGENYTANSVNQYTQIWVPYEINPTFDADGNQLTTALGQAYVWDAENRLISVEPVVATAGSPKITYVYDGFSRRVRRTAFTFTNGAWVQGSDVKFIYEGWNVVGVLGWNTATGTFVLQKTYTWGLDLSGSLQGAGVGGLLGVSEITSGQVSASYHFMYDANGNVGQLLNASGSVVAHYEYDAFGGAIQSLGVYAGQNEYRFSTKPFDGASGLYYYGFRYYSPSTGRWISKDPIGERGGLNLYEMVRNNTIGLIDNLGLNVTREPVFPYFDPGFPEGQIPVKKTWILASEKHDTIECRGYKLQTKLKNMSFDKECTKAHEETHVADYKDHYGDDVCKGVPDGYVPTGGPGWEDFRRQTECNAHKAGKECREKLRSTCPAASKQDLEDQIKKDQEIMNEYCG